MKTMEQQNHPMEIPTPESNHTPNILSNIKGLSKGIKFAILIALGAVGQGCVTTEKVGHLSVYAEKVEYIYGQYLPKKCKVKVIKGNEKTKMRLVEIKCKGKKAEKNLNEVIFVFKYKDL